MTNILELKTVNELQAFDFYVPSYQRGYRWSETEVVELLNDIADFNPRQVGDHDEKTWYCLQPIVVKKRQDNTYEVIDGQQRLTTIYLILFYLNQDFVTARRDKLFNIKYQTRVGSEDFLRGLDDIKNESSNVDFFYIAKAYRSIVKWFDDNEKDSSFDKDNFRSKFRFNSKVIWYESDESDSIAIFTRINIGKIPLTNSELIKALFLNSSNFNKNEEKIRLRQLEISTEWDFIEQSLQNNRFWYFLNQNGDITNRIELIFDLMNEEPDPFDNYSTFRFFSKKFSTKNPNVIDINWGEVKRYFQRFNEWFHERDLYHKIGYLISVGAIKLQDLYAQSDNLKKTEFRDYLDNLIRDSLKNIDLNTLQYSDSNNVRKTLLIYNILTMLNSEKDNSYFPFDLYKNERWDIEHIASVKERMPDQNREDWLRDAKVFIDSSAEGAANLIERIDLYGRSKNDMEFRSIFEDVVSHFNSGLSDQEDVNDITNLTLLDSETNRGYKNAVFPFKRKIIIDRDKSGTFIPVCTKNVFLKYFSDYPPKISFWTEDDRLNYERDLSNVLDPFLKKNEAIQ